MYFAVFTNRRYIITRINCIPVEELTDKHLGAEYRELPRLFALVLQAQVRGEVPRDRRNPIQYVLGAGHVRFFYPRLGYIKKRFEQLVAECKRRGRTVNFAELPNFTKHIDNEWFGDWEPDARALELNRARIALRIKESKSK